ncbi:MAG TPA: hypothetical protein VNB24_02940 [Acidimicrobiales bacterium]|nr:hypothetical protein [Acidimicrobiales bacterium]
MTSLSISCNDCVMQHSSHCDDCIVTFLCDEDGAMPVAIEDREVRALRLLSAGGLVPELRHRADPSRRAS